LIDPNHILGQLLKVSRLQQALTACSAAPASTIMLIRQLLAASLLSFTLLSLAGSALTTKAADPPAYCKADAKRMCPGVARDGGKLAGCLKERENEVSIGCAKALKSIKTKMGK
jgi:hypothetical protein